MFLLSRQVFVAFSIKSHVFSRKSIHQAALSLPHLKRLNQSDSEIVAQKLKRLCGDQNVSVAEAVRLQHGQDEGPDRGETPDVVVFPNSVEEVSEICKFCNSESIPIIPFGTGTGVEGGINALYGGVCMDLKKIDGILDYHPEDFDVTVRPGVMRETLNHFVKDDGLWFPVDPGANASICGMCATSASGTNAVRYGTMKENCMNLEVVLADGRILHTNGEGKRPKKSSAGYNLTNLIVGSEGTLGVITKATIKLHAQPESIAAVICSFDSIEEAMRTVVSILQSSLPMARMELLDEVSVHACNKYSNLTLEEKPTLFLEFHSSQAGLDDQTRTVSDIAIENGGSNFQFAKQTEDRNRLWAARHKLYYACLNLKPGCRAINTDVCVPISLLPQMVAETKIDLNEAGIIAPLFGHVGDGNFHTVLLFDPDNKSEFMVCKEVSRKMGMRALAMGGTCTGEHGVGTGKISLLEEMFGPVPMDMMWSLKNAFDPKGIMNPGKVLRPRILTNFK